MRVTPDSLRPADARRKVDGACRVTPRAERLENLVRREVRE